MEFILASLCYYTWRHIIANPLQPKIAKILVEEYDAYIINVVMASRAGHMDIVACIKGLFYGFEIKWKNDQPSELQKGKINDLIDAGGKGYFIRSEANLRDVLDNNLIPVRYEVKTRFKL